MKRLSPLQFAQWQQEETNHRLKRLRHGWLNRLIPVGRLAYWIEREAKVCRLATEEFAKHFTYNKPFDNGVESKPEDRFLIFG
jgi:hypothetical protein